MTDTVLKGTLKVWKDDRGFGFIQSETSDKDVFLHISALRGMARRPMRGDIIYYDIAQDQNGKVKAINARIEGVEYVAKPNKTSKSVLIWTAIAGLLTASAVLAYQFWPQAQ